MQSFKGRIGVFVSIAAFCGVTFAQQTVSFDAVRSAFTSQSKINSVVLDGSFAATRGTLRQNGQAHLVANSDGSYSTKLSVDSNDLIESRSLLQANFECVWQDGSAKAHQETTCDTPAWFLPELQLFASSEVSPEWVAQLTLNQAGSSQLAVQSHHEPDKANHSPATVHAMTIDLETGTYLPSRASFDAVADRFPNRSVHIAVTYGDYRTISGVAIPFHIQKLINGTVVLDIVLTSASVN